MGQVVLNQRGLNFVPALRVQHHPVQFGVQRRPRHKFLQFTHAFGRGVELQLVILPGIRNEDPEAFAGEMEKRIMRGELVGGLAGGEEQAAEDFEQTGIEEDLVFGQFACFGEQGHGQEQHRFMGALEAVGVGRAVQAGESG